VQGDFRRSRSAISACKVSPPLQRRRLFAERPLMLRVMK
jgi:hypothetical protein